MLHEPESTERQQHLNQPETRPLAAFKSLGNFHEQHAAKRIINTILPHASNKLIVSQQQIFAASQQHAEKQTAAAATMLLVLGQRKIGATYLKPKPNISLWAIGAPPNVAQQNADLSCKQDESSAALSKASNNNSDIKNNDNSSVTAAFDAYSSCLQESSTNVADKMLLVRNKSNNDSSEHNNNNKISKIKQSNYNNDNKVAPVPQYAAPDSEKVAIDFNRRRRRGRLRCKEQRQLLNEVTKINTTIKTTTTAPPLITTTTTTAVMSAFSLKTKTQATFMPTNTETETKTKTKRTNTTRTATTPITLEPTPITTSLKSSAAASQGSFFDLLLLCLTGAYIKLCLIAAAAVHSNMTTYCNKFATLALSCLTALQSYVNTIATLVLTTATRKTVKTPKTAITAVAATSITTTTSAARTRLADSLYANKQTALANASTTSAATFAINNCRYIHHRYRNSILAAAAVSAQQRLTSHSSSNNCCCYKQLIYVFLLFTNILPRHSNNLYAEAAKPKSATQSHQHQQQQQQQQHQHQQPNTQLQPYDVGNNGVLSQQPDSYQGVSSQTSMEDDTELLYPSSQSEEQLFDMDEDENAAYETPTNATHYANTTVIKTPLFPKDIFSKQQLEDGWVFCHIIGVIYMFVALAIVCDEFFVPSLDVIIEKLDITDDVAGATFMAAGGSAPELFTSVIGVFVSFDDVGIGTIVGSAVFNILFVIGMCALFSKTVLTLTWWPLFRDCTFYSISLIVLIIFFRDNKIYWYEALILFSIYIAYVVFMKWNVQVERFVKKLITRNQGNAANSSETSMATQPGGSVTSRAASETRSGPAGGSTSGATGNSSGATASSTQTGAKFRHGLLQLMIHTIDPLHDGKVDEKATQLHAIASLKVLLDATKPQRGGATTSAANHVKINLKETTLADRPNGNIDTTLDSPSLSGRRPSWIEQRVKIQTRKFSIKQTNEIEDEPEPLSMAWPDTARKRLTYILVAPLLIPMWLTLPDTRSPRGKKFFAITFCGSILWIAAFSYLMVWWANVAGETAKIPPEVMGLTFLAAGTSIPDLITSVIVARKGYGDMAVSSSVGSNIFDVTVGLPIPWLLYGLIYGAPVEVNSVGMVCSITILFMMLLFVVMSIACFRWRMNKGLGFTMFMLYFVFVAVSLMFEYDVIRCPV